MPSAFEAQLGTDSEVFSNPDEFGETVVYTPRGGSPKTISAAVVRFLQEELDDTDSVNTPLMHVYVRNDATYGVASVNTGGDTVTVAYRKGGTAKAYQVHGAEDGDAGMWCLTLR